MKGLGPKAIEVGIIGLGYVGLKEAVAFSDANIKVRGYDINIEKVTKINNGISPIGTVDNQEIDRMLKKGCIFTTDYEQLIGSNFLIIAVPTPLGVHREPNLEYLNKAMLMISKIYDNSKVIIMESTTYPGCTDEMIEEYINTKGFMANYAFCGEREDPGGESKFADIPRVLGASNPETLEACKNLYEQIVSSVHEVSSVCVAEITKLYENIYRAVNIGLVNEFKMLCLKMNIDPFEVINAARTKPFGFRPFFPGPGLGGHCIPIDPFYLTWTAKKYDLNLQFIELSGIVNSLMPEYVVDKLISSLYIKTKSIIGCKILICGVSYKKNVEDTRNSPSAPIAKSLAEKQAIISLYDPVVGKYSDNYEGYEVNKEVPNESFDASLILVDHDLLEIDKIISSSEIVVDSRGVLELSNSIFRA